MKKGSGWLAQLVITHARERATGQLTRQSIYILHTLSLPPVAGAPARAYPSSNRMEIYGPPSPPPLPSSPEAPEGTDRSAAVLRPPIAALPALVDAAMSAVKLHMYKVPPDLVDAMDLALNVSCVKMRIKHRWIDLENMLWKSLPPSVWTDDPEAASFFVVPHAFISHQCLARMHITKHYAYSGTGALLRLHLLCLTLLQPLRRP